MSDFSSGGQKASKMTQKGSKPSKQEAPRVATLTKSQARNDFANRIEGSSTGKVQ